MANHRPNSAPKTPTGMSAGDTEVTDSHNSLTGYQVNTEVLETALQELALSDEHTATEQQQQQQQPSRDPDDGAGGVMLYESGIETLPFESEYEQNPNNMEEDEWAELLQNSSSRHGSQEFILEEPELSSAPDPQLRSETPRYVVDNDPILVGDNVFEASDATVDQQVQQFTNRLIMHRNVLVDLNASLDPSRDFYDYDGINMAGLIRSPTNFLVIGKPGVGSTTFAEKFAEKMNLVYISPSSAVEYLKSTSELSSSSPPPPSFLLTPKPSTLEIDYRASFDAVCKRIQAGDVKHRGYILDGWPTIKSEDIDVEEQLEMLKKQLPSPPDVVFFLQMQDKDLFNRRIEQKLDPFTGTVYIKKHYIRTSLTGSMTIPAAAQIMSFNNTPSNIPVVNPSGVSNAISTSHHDNLMSVTTISSTGLHDRDKRADKRLRLQEDEQDFVPLVPEVVGRLVSRMEDHPEQVKKDFILFTEALPTIQTYLNSLDRTRVFELDAYFSPMVLVKNALDIASALGLVPAAIPVEIFRPAKDHHSKQLGAEDGEGYFSEGCIPDPNDPESKKEDYPVDWEAIMRAVVVRGRLDPRFRWRISPWKNLCPVALKEGRSLVGCPERAYGLHDKVYFICCEESVAKFKLDPRQYLVKDMPSSPIKFFVVGHPLGGKTLFSQYLALLSGGIVIDMKLQVKKLLEVCKQRLLFKARLEATMEAKKIVNKLNYQDWKREERNRREKINKWIADYFRKKAAEEINRALAAEREERMKKYRRWRYESEYHELGAPFKASPCTAEPLAFSWKKFVEDIKRGVEAWTHQQRLELAWELFNEGKLRYKSKSRPGCVRLRKVKRRGSGDSIEAESDEDDEEEEGEGEKEDEESEENDESEPGESDEEEKKKRKKRRRKRPYCKKKSFQPAEVAVVTEDEAESSPLPSDAEPDESIRMMYPDLCSELTESVPRPGLVEDQNEQVQAYVSEKMRETEKWLSTLPSEIYEEILQTSIHDAEDLYRKKYPNSHTSGGWIIENLIQDVDKWRSILRKPAFCPDQIFVLQDSTPGYSHILNRLKRFYLASNPGRNISIRRKRLGNGFEGEGYLSEREVPGEVLIINDDTLEGEVCNTASETLQLAMDRNRMRSQVQSFSELGTEKLDLRSSLRRSLPEPPMYSMSPSSARLDPECTKQWLSSASERRLGLGPALKKGVTAEMTVLLPLEAALRTVKGYDEASETEEEEMTSYSTEPQRTSRDDFNRAAEGPKSRPDPDPQVMEYGGSEGGEDDADILTPDGLRTPELQLLCLPEDENCTEPEQTMSLKKAFVKTINAFNEFWNMVYPVVSEQKVSSWEVGTVDELSAKSTTERYWRLLEGRFALPPKPVTAGEFEEDDADVLESKRMWAGNKGEEDDSGATAEGEEEDNEYEGEGLDEEDAEDELNFERSVRRLRGLEHQPDLYRKTLEGIEEGRLFGDFKYYCPVTLYDLQLIRKGNPKYALRYQERLYYFVSAEASARFKENPSKFLPPTSAKCIPPPRICITGAPACGQKEVAIAVSQKAGIFYVNFRDRLQEIMKSRVGANVGPYYTGTIVTEPDSLPSTPDERSSHQSLDGEDGGATRGEGDSWNMWDGAEKRVMEQLALTSLEPAKIASYPMDSIDRVEAKARETSGKRGLSAVDKHVKAFLECGTQLPTFVLDEFLPALWHEEPFKSIGFLLVGFPNTAKDVQYLVERGCYPEKIYVLECRKTTCRNRLVREAVQLWHSQRKSTDPRRKPKILYPHQQRPDRSYGAKESEYQDIPPKDDETNVDIWCSGDKVCVRAGRVLHYFHLIVTQAFRAMKMELNHRRLPWASINTDLSLMEGKAELRKKLTPTLQFRRNFFESTYVLNSEQAEVLIQKKYFHLTKFKRFCPVEVYKGNQGINLWSAPGVVKYPVLYRNYIYFIAGEKNLEAFRNQTLDMTEQLAPLPSAPFHIVVLGPPKSGKTELATRIANNLGLQYIDEDEVIERIIEHARASELEYAGSSVREGPQPMIFSKMVHAYLKRGHSVPPYMYYRALDFALLQPLAQFQGCVFDGYPMEDTSIQLLLDQGIIPTVIIQLELDVESALKRAESRRMIQNFNYKTLTPDCDELIRKQYDNYGPTNSPCVFGFGEVMQCSVKLDGRKNPAEMYTIVANECIKAQTFNQNRILKFINRRLSPFPPGGTNLSSPRLVFNTQVETSPV